MEKCSPKDSKGPAIMYDVPCYYILEGNDPLGAERKANSQYTHCEPNQDGDA